MKNYKVQYMVNKQMNIIEVVAVNERAAVAEANRILKGMKISFVIYGVR